MRFLVSVLALLWLGCAPPSSEPCVIPNGGSGGSSATDLSVVGLTGQPMSVALELGTVVDCQGLAIADRVDTVVLDPDNREIEHTATKPLASNLVPNATTITFVPTRSGAYHLEARFEPSLGQVQRDVFVASDRRDAGAAVAQTTTKCDRYELTSHGTVVCSVSNTLIAYRSDGGVEPLGNGSPLQHAVSGDTVWIVSANALSRWVDTGSQLVRSGTPCALPTSVQNVSATADSALAVSSDEAREVSFSDAGECVVSGLWSFPPTAGVQAAGWNGSVGLVGNTDTGFRRLQSGDAGVQLVVPGATNTAAAAFGPDGAWSFVVEGMTFVPVAGDVVSAGLPTLWAPPTGGESTLNTAPILATFNDTDRIVASFENGSIDLQWWESRGERVVQVTPTHVVKHVGQQWLFYRR